MIQCRCELSPQIMKKQRFMWAFLLHAVTNGKNCFSWRLVKVKSGAEDPSIVWDVWMVVVVVDYRWFLFHCRLSHWNDYYCWKGKERERIVLYRNLVITRSSIFSYDLFLKFSRLDFVCTQYPSTRGQSQQRVSKVRD